MDKWWRRSAEEWATSMSIGAGHEPVSMCLDACILNMKVVDLVYMSRPKAQGRDR